jgi:hypothetical protein
MTTFAPTISPRWKGTYICAGLRHTIQFRGARGASFITMDEYRHVGEGMVANIRGDFCSDFTWVQAEVALTDSDVFLPATTPAAPTAGGNSISDYSPIDKISAMTLSGKSSTARARFSWYGLLFLSTPTGTIGADGLVRISELAGLAGIIAQANASCKAADGTSASYHSIATYKPNDHLLKLVRRGTIS